MSTVNLAPLLDAQVGFLAKSDGELLWTHHLLVRWIAQRMAAYIPSITAEETRLLDLAALTHDVGKATSEVQAYLRGSIPGPVSHKVGRAQYRDAVEAAALRAGFSLEEVCLAWEILAPHHYVSKQDVVETSSPRIEKLSQILIEADRLASMRRPDVTTINEVRSKHQHSFDLTYFQVSRFSSPTLDLVLATVANLYRAAGWEPLAYLPETAIMIGRPGLTLPSKDLAISSVAKEIIDSTWRHRGLEIRSYTGTILGGIAAELPRRFLEANRGTLMTNLADGTLAPMYFFKLAFEILNTCALLNQMKKKSLLLDILALANSTTWHKLAKKRYTDSRNAPAPDRIDKEFFAPFFSSETIGAFLPDRREIERFKTAVPSKLRPDELFDILMQLAKLAEREEGPLRQGMKRDLQAWIAMQEETDFVAYAREQLDRYKAYKKEFKQSKGSCERCACTTTVSITKADRFSSASQSSSQIKSGYGNERALCPFCVHDNLVSVSRGERVFLHLHTRIPGHTPAFPAVARFVLKLVSGLRLPRRFKRAADIGELSGFALPPRMRFPWPDEDDEQSDRITPLPRGDRGVLIDLQQWRKDSALDLAAKYEPVYHLLKIMGFEIAVGKEEQEGLFGKHPETSAQAYYSSLAAVLMAGCTGKKSNRYLFARQLLERAPAVALAAAFSESEGNRPRMARDLLPFFVDFLRDSGLVVARREGGNITMEGLLRDAAFLADRERGMFRYCDRPAGGNWWDSKHAASKPIAQALRQLLNSRSPDIAKQTFRNHLSDKIKRDDPDFVAFVEGVDLIIEKYHDLRNSDITQFLRAKNALISAVFTFTQYPALMKIEEEKDD